MSDAVLVAIVTGGCTLAATYMVHKWSAEREDRRHTVDVSRERALERIEKLYKPLLKMLDPGPPYDEFYIEPRDLPDIIKHIENNEILASPDLIDILWDLRRGYYGQEGVSSDLQHELLILANREHEHLKVLLGYGKIIEKDGIIRRGFATIVDGIKNLGAITKNALFRLRMKRRGKWMRKKKR